MQIQYGTDGSVKIIGDHSIQAIVCTAEVTDHFGGPVEAFHSLKQMHSHLPRRGGEKYPTTMRDIVLANKNVAAGYRKWQWRSLQGYGVREVTGYDCVWGYGYINVSGTEFTFTDKNGDAVYKPIRIKEN